MKFLLSLALLLAAALSRFWLAPLATRLPADYALELTYEAEDRFRNTPDGEWVAATLTVRGTQQALSVFDGIALIQGELHWYGEDDEIIFESAGLYGVDRRTRANNPAYGDQPRAGHFLFPPRVERTSYMIWDTQYIGPREATFERLETLDGLTVYVFSFRTQGLDETDGYDTLPGVPERYHTLTDGEGTFWVEPISGVTVDYEEIGVSYFVNASNGEHIADVHQWSDRFAPATRAAQLAAAHSARLRLLALEIWIPGAALLSAFLTFSLSLPARNVKQSPAQPAIASAERFAKTSEPL